MGRVVTSPEQFGQLFTQLRSGRGFSEHLPTGQHPASGYMVSDYGAEHTIPSAETTPDHLRDYAEHTGLATAKRGDYFGGWASEGNDYLDRSRRYPTAERAQSAMALQHQQAAYVVRPQDRADKADPYLANPHYEPPVPESESATKGVSPTWLRPTTAKNPKMKILHPRGRGS